MILFECQMFFRFYKVFVLAMCIFNYILQFTHWYHYNNCMLFINSLFTFCCFSNLLYCSHFYNLSGQFSLLACINDLPNSLLPYLWFIILYLLVFFLFTHFLKRYFSQLSLCPSSLPLSLVRDCCSFSSPPHTHLAFYKATIPSPAQELLAQASSLS